MDINPFIWTLIGNLFLGLWIIWSIYIVMLFKNKFINKLDYLTSLTVWLLIGIIFLGFIPEIFESSISWEFFGIYILSGLLLFYILELFLHWHHCKDLWDTGCSHWHETEHKSQTLMFTWTLLHNAFHWVILFSAFSVNFNFWIVTTLALLLHAIPQNIANYIMNHNNLKYALIAAFGWIIWAILTYPFYDFLINHKFEILSIITGWLLYTALTDIFPNIKEKWELKHKVIYLWFIVFWVVLFSFFNELTHSWHEEHEKHDHNEEHHEENKMNR